MFKIGFLWDGTFLRIISDYKFTEDGSYKADIKHGSNSGIYSKFLNKSNPINKQQNIYLPIS
jgi:hypothetical protein